MSPTRFSTNKTKAFSDLITAIYSWRVWYTLGMQDILLRYRGSTLGPFWITISTAINAVSMGYLYGMLFSIDRGTYLPYFTTGIITWNFISMIINESTKILLESKHYMENIQLPCIMYIFRLIFRNVIIFIHNLPVFIVVAFIYKIPFNFYSLNLCLGMLILCLNGIFFSTIIAFISTRFPDVGSVVSSILQVFFFITPIMWVPSALPAKYHLFLTINPFSYFVDLLRNPLLGLPFEMSTLIGAFALTLLGLSLYIPIMRTYGKRVIFWL